MDLGDAVGNQQEELSPDGAKRRRSEGVSPVGSRVPRARWRNSDDGEGAWRLPTHVSLFFEDQVATETAALGRQEGSDTRKPRSPTAQGAEPSDQHSGRAQHA